MRDRGADHPQFTPTARILGRGEGMGQIFVLVDGDWRLDCKITADKSRARAPATAVTLGRSSAAPAGAPGPTVLCFYSIEFPQY
jgi:hypothetical protein